MKRTILLLLLLLLPTLLRVSSVYANIPGEASGIVEYRYPNGQLANAPNVAVVKEDNVGSTTTSRTDGYGVYRFSNNPLKSDGTVNARMNYLCKYSDSGATVCGDDGAVNNSTPISSMPNCSPEFFYSIGNPSRSWCGTNCGANNHKLYLRNPVAPTGYRIVGVSPAEYVDLNFGNDANNAANFRFTISIEQIEIPETPTVLGLPSCIATEVSGTFGDNIGTISWSSGSFPISWVDISSNPNFSHFSNAKILNGDTSIGIVKDFNSATHGTKNLVIMPETTYYVRTWNGYAHSQAVAFTVPLCAQPTQTQTPTPSSIPTKTQSPTPSPTQSPSPLPTTATNPILPPAPLDSLSCTYSYTSSTSGINYFTVTHSWSPVTSHTVDMATYPYQSEASRYADFSQKDIIGWYYGWTPALSDTSSAYSDGETFYAHVRSMDISGNISAFSTTKIITLSGADCASTPNTPTPSIAPTMTPGISISVTPSTTLTLTTTPTGTITQTPTPIMQPVIVRKRVSDMSDRVGDSSKSVVTYIIDVYNPNSFSLSDLDVVDFLGDPDVDQTIISVLATTNVEGVTLTNNDTRFSANISTIEAGNSAGMVVAVEVEKGILSDCAASGSMSNVVNLNQISVTPVIVANATTGIPCMTHTPTPSPTNTPTATPTPTPSISGTPSSTPTITVTPTFTLTPTITHTPTVTPTGTTSPTPSLTPTGTLTPAPTDAELGDYVWQDSNDNGLQDSGESPISGVDVQLVTCNNTTTAIATTQTDSLGRYYFRTLVAGCYRVRFAPLASHRPCSKVKVQNEGHPNTDNNASSDGYTGEITLAASESNMSIDACMIRNPVQTDVSLTKVANKAEFRLWDEVMFTLVIKNDGANRASGIIVKDYFPSGLIYIAHDAINQDREVYNEHDHMWSVGSLEVGASKELRIIAKVNELKNIINITEVYSLYETDIDSTPNNLVATEDDYASVTIIPLVEIAAESTPQLANTGVATTITFALGSGLLIAAIALEEMRGRMRGKWGEEESTDLES